MGYAGFESDKVVLSGARTNLDRGRSEGWRANWHLGRAALVSSWRAAPAACQSGKKIHFAMGGGAGGGARKRVVEEITAQGNV